jgi:hypothetical protein
MKSRLEKVNAKRGHGCAILENEHKRIIDIPAAVDDNVVVPAQRAGSRYRFLRNFMIKRQPSSRPRPVPEVSETEPQRFERILARDRFKPLKAVLDTLGITVPIMQAAIVTTNSYQMFLGKLGYRLNCVPQVHERDCYSRLGPAGGIRAVLPVHDLVTYSTLVTLVNFDSSITTTSNSIDFYDNQLAAFKTDLMNKSGDAN